MISISQKSEELRLNNLVLNLTITKPWLKSCIFKRISWLNGSFFRGRDRGFFGKKKRKKKEKRIQDLLNSFLKSPILSAFTSIVYGSRLRSQSEDGETWRKCVWKTFELTKVPAVVVTAQDAYVALVAVVRPWHRHPSAFRTGLVAAHPLLGWWRRLDRASVDFAPFIMSA